MLIVADTFTNDPPQYLRRESLAPDSLPISALASQEHERMVRAYLNALTADRHAIDDLSQEVFMRAIQRLDLFEFNDDPARTLRAIARRVAHEHFRSRRREREHVDCTLDHLAAEDKNVAAAILQRESLAQLRAAVDDLPIISRRLLELRYHDGLSSKHIGEQLGLSDIAVRVTLLRIRERLLRRLDSPLSARP